MPATLVTYDLHKEKSDSDRAAIRQTIKTIGSWARLSESSYAVNTLLSPSEIHGKLRPYLDANDHIYIIRLTQPHSGFGPTDVNEWLRYNL